MASRRSAAFALFSLALAVASCKTPEIDWEVVALEVEHLDAPLGIDARTPRLSWKLASSGRNERQSRYRVVIGSSPGESDVWQTEEVSKATFVDYGGPPLASRQRYFWSVEAWNRDGSASSSAESFWEMGLLEPWDWKASWIGFATVEEREAREPSESAPSPYLRKRFTIDSPVKRARLYATALGVYELHLNGERVGDAFFTPGWTEYKKRLQVQTYDVTALVREGDNALGAILGDGWYAGTIGWEKKRHHYGPYPLGLLAQLEIDHEDGTTSIVATDESWRASAGPILSSDFLMGETYDARLEMPEWSRAEFEDSSWKEVKILPPPEAKLAARLAPFERRTEELVPIARTEPEPGVYVFDLGQNMVGWARLKLEAEAGTKVVLRFAEVLSPDGTLYTESLRSARATDTYIARGTMGEGPEVFEPHFTFHGFRYVELRGYPGPPPLEAVTGIVVHSDMAKTGRFETSSPMLNQLQRNIVWSQRGNFLSIPTDCPQRDERLGWMGDAQIFAKTACFNMDVAAFFAKWLVDVEDAQTEEGVFSDVSPRIIVETDGAPGWGDAGVIVPWTLYRCYGDERFLGRQYRAMKKWVDFTRRANPDGIRKNRVGNNYGDWVAVGSDTSKELIGTAFYAHVTDLLSRAAETLGHEEDAGAYRSLFQSLRDTFVATYLEEDGRLSSDTQTAYALALRFGLVPEESRPRLIARFVESIERNDNHLTTGFLGVRHLLPALSENGRTDVAYRLLMNESFPSWGYEIRNGATTLWERWDGYTKEKGFQDPGMNSFNHYAYGSVGEWMYENVAGIDASRLSENEIVIRPHPGGGLTHAEASFDSVHGTIESRWKLEGTRFELQVTIPVNLEAEVHVPGASGSPFRVGSGSHVFASQLERTP